GFELGELDIEADEVAAFPGDDDDAALIVRLDQRLAANVREIGDGQHIHDPPGVVGGIAAKLAPNRGTDHAARTVAAYRVADPARFGLALMWSIEPLECDRHPLLITAAAARCGLNGNDSPGIIRLKFRG